MKKTLFTLILASLVLFYGFCADDLSSKHINNVLPLDSLLGQTADSETSENHAILFTALSEEYSFEWLETYLASDFREIAARLWSEKLSSILPAKQFVMSVGRANADSSVSISVRLLGTEQVIHFAIRDGLIEAMGF